MYLDTVINYISSCGIHEFDANAVARLGLCATSVLAPIIILKSNKTCSNLAKTVIVSLFLPIILVSFTITGMGMRFNVTATGNPFYTTYPREGKPSHFSSEGDSLVYELDSMYTYDTLKSELEARTDNTLLTSDGEEVTFNSKYIHVRKGNKNEIKIFTDFMLPENEEYMATYEKGYETLTNLINKGYCKDFKDSANLLNNDPQSYLDSKVSSATSIITVKA